MYGTVVGLGYAAALAAVIFGAPVVAQTTASASTPSAAVSDRVFATPVTIRLDRVSLRRALAEVAKAAHVALQYQTELLDMYQQPVTLRAADVPLGTILSDMLRGTNLRAVPAPGDMISIEANVDPSAHANGGVAGTVTDAKTHQPLARVAVTVDNATKGVMTDEKGHYDLRSIAAGEHRITVKMLGYARQTKAVTVVDGSSIGADFQLSENASMLDQVVVTGTVVPTELKAVPNAITVITAKDIEQRGVTHIDQLFRGDVPGLFARNSGSSGGIDSVVMFSRGASKLPSSAALDPYGTAASNSIKTYVDGVELADPRFLNQIDPKSIERVEILAGPQASTIYGSNAINGVMQIFTKRGVTSRPQLTATLLTGTIQNNFSPAYAPQHDVSAQVSGIEEHISYNVGGTWNFIGAWTPDKRTSTLGGFGGARWQSPLLTADVTFRQTQTRNLEHGAPDQASTVGFATGVYYTGYGWFTPGPARSTLSGTTWGATLTATPVSFWSHELGIGMDASDVERLQTAPGYNLVVQGDTLLSVSDGRTAKTSLRYVTTARAPLSSFANGILVLGADGWKSSLNTLTSAPMTLSGALIDPLMVVQRFPSHDAGLFAQAQLNLWDAIFLTYGGRAEWNPEYGANEQPNYAPRYGISMTHTLGDLTLKLRGSYGRSTRPPQFGQKSALTIGQLSPILLQLYGPLYGNFDNQLANPNLAAEHQQGGEGGIEAYFGNFGSLIVTRYNQTVDDLIVGVQADSVRSLFPLPPNSYFYHSKDAQGYGYTLQNTYLNLGSVRNQGWELQGTVNTGPLTTKGTYSWTKSRLIGIAPRYASLVQGTQYAVGTPFTFLPEHTWALGTSYARAGTTISLNLTGTGFLYRMEDDVFNFSSDFTGVRLQESRVRMSILNGYRGRQQGYTMADLNVSRDLGRNASLLLQVQNLTDLYRNDLSVNMASIGRQTKAGVRIRM